jgi:PAS domain S-box-containing protein
MPPPCPIPRTAPDGSTPPPWSARVAERTGTPVVVTDAARRIVWLNEAFTRRTGYPLEELRGAHPGRLLQFERTDPATVRRIGAALAEGSPVREAIENRSAGAASATGSTSTSSRCTMP